MQSHEIRRAACAIFGPVTWADEDSAETKAGVKEHNAVYVKTCGTGPK